jgi:holo-[acyl-carrier protein] synthase
MGWRSSVHHRIIANMPVHALAEDLASQLDGRLQVGIDIVQISRVVDSLQRFGERFMQCLFTRDEIAWAMQSGALTAERLAARFAAKEAAIKAFDLGEAGVAWRDIEVRRVEGGACRLALHGKAATLVFAQGIEQIALSLSHDGNYAVAVVTAYRRPASQTDQATS